MYDYRVRNVVITGQLNVLNTSILFIFRSAERTFPTAECTFPTAEHTFRSGEYKPFTLLLQVHNGYPLNIRITIIPKYKYPIQSLPFLGFINFYYRCSRLRNMDAERLLG